MSSKGVSDTPFLVDELLFGTEGLEHAVGPVARAVEALAELLEFLGPLPLVCPFLDCSAYLKNHSFEDLVFGFVLLATFEIHCCPAGVSLTYVFLLCGRTHSHHLSILDDSTMTNTFLDENVRSHYQGSIPLVRAFRGP